MSWRGMSESALNVESYFQSHREQMSETIILILIVFIFQILCYVQREKLRHLCFATRNQINEEHLKKKIKCFSIFFFSKVTCSFTHCYESKNIVEKVKFI